MEKHRGRSVSTPMVKWFSAASQVFRKRNKKITHHCRHFSTSALVLRLSSQATKNQFHKRESLGAALVRPNCGQRGRGGGVPTVYKSPESLFMAALLPNGFYCIQFTLSPSLHSLGSSKTIQSIVKSKAKAEYFTKF